MRRSLALVALAAVTAMSTPASAAREVPPPPLPKDCNVFQNCLCSTANFVLAKATGDPWLHCA